MATHTVVPPVKLHHRLRIALEWASLEPEDMAVTLDMHINSVHNYIAGRTTPKHPVLVLWAETCKVPVDWLKNGVDTGTDTGADSLQEWLGIERGIQLADERNCWSPDQLSLELLAS